MKAQRKKISKQKNTSPVSVIKEVLRYLFCFVFLAGLGSVVYFTRSFAVVRNEQAHLREVKISLRSVLPPFDNKPWEESFWIQGKQIFPAWKFSQNPDSKDRGVLVGAAFRSEILELRHAGKLLIGVDPQGHITGIRAETEKSDKYADIVKASDLFFLSLEGRSKEDLFLNLDPNSETLAALPPEFVQAILKTLYSELEFFSNNRKLIFENADKTT